MPTGLEKVSFHSNPKEGQCQRIRTTAQLCSFHVLAKSFKLGFSSTWTENFQLYKLDLEKAEELEIKLPIPIGWITINWKIFQEMRIPNHLTCLLRKLYAGQEATSYATRRGKTDWFKIGKGARQGWILSPCLFNFFAEYIMWNAGLDEAQAEIRIARRNINNLR